MDQDLALIENILGDAKSGRLRLPSLPDVALRVRKAVGDPKKSVSDVVRVVQFDPAQAARLIQVANSPLCRGVVKINNCHAAVMRLGLNATRNLVTSFAMRNIFRAKSNYTCKRLEDIWHHSCRVAAISSVLARVTPGLDPDRALLAGLIHDVGVSPLLPYIELSPDLNMEETRLDKIIEKLRGVLGTFILKTWKFENDLAEVPKQVENWNRNGDSRADYIDIVQVAHIHSQFGNGQAYNGPPLTELKSFNKMTISKLGPGASFELLEQSQQEICQYYRNTTVQLAKAYDLLSADPCKLVF